MRSPKVKLLGGRNRKDRDSSPGSLSASITIAPIHSVSTVYFGWSSGMDWRALAEQQGVEGL